MDIQEGLWSKEGRGNRNDIVSLSLLIKAEEVSEPESTPEGTRISQQ